MPLSIEAIELRKSFKKVGYRNLFPWRRQSISALKGISFEVKKEELFGILGPNGAGKTSLIKILCTLILPDSGTALINGYDIYRHEKKIKKYIGYITSEERSFFWRLTGNQNLHFFATLYNLSSEETKKRINYLVNLLDLKKEIDMPFMGYSSGIKQRLSIARGLLRNPEILLMDEPTRSLDPLAKLRLQQFIKENLVGEQKKTVFLATHDLLEAEYLCDRLAILSQGKIVAIGKVDAIKKSLGKKKKVLLRLKTHRKNVFDKLLKINGVYGINVSSYLNGITSLEVELNNEEVIPSVLTHLVHKKISILSCTPKEPSLKEVLEQVIV